MRATLSPLTSLPAFNWKSGAAQRASIGRRPLSRSPLDEPASLNRRCRGDAGSQPPAPVTGATRQRTTVLGVGLFPNGALMSIFAASFWDCSQLSQACARLASSVCFSSSSRCLA